MSDNRNDNGLLISDTLVPDIFITQHIHELTKDAICLYMWLLMIVRNTSFEESYLSNYGVLSASDRKNAFSELISNDLVYKNSDNKYYLSDLKMREIEEYSSLLACKKSIPDSDILASDKDRDILANSISKTFYLGKMNLINYRLIDKCLYEYKFDSSVVYRLFETAVNDKKQYKINYIQKMAENWFKKGYTTPDKLQKMFDHKKREEELIKHLGKLMRKRLDGPDIEKIELMISEYDVSTELVDYAYRNNEYRGTITLKNVYDKIKEWFLADVKTVDQALVYESKKRDENKAKSSRRKSGSSSWRTGSEAGIDLISSSSQETKKHVEDDTNDDDQDDILNLFGGIDEDN